MEGGGLHNEFSRWIHWRFLHHFLSTFGWVRALGLCGEESGVHAIGCVNPSETMRRTHWGSSKCKALREISLATGFSISIASSRALNSPISLV